MENWRDDFDSLIQETMAFVKGVCVEPPLSRSILEPNRTPSISWMSSAREEILQGAMPSNVSLYERLGDELAKHLLLQTDPAKSGYGYMIRLSPWLC
jgi:hypothetical protein